eukprot:m.52751 g.52751  ORF g.52751 m.52751 type:complete len:387 (-) comp7633_c0_seq1:210-1370(-)
MCCINEHYLLFKILYQTIPILKLCIVDILHIYIYIYLYISIYILRNTDCCGHIFFFFFETMTSSPSLLVVMAEMEDLWGLYEVERLCFGEEAWDARSLRECIERRSVWITLNEASIIIGYIVMYVKQNRPHHQRRHNGDTSICGERECEDRKCRVNSTCNDDACHSRNSDNEDDGCNDERVCNYISNLGIHPEWRRKGVARLMMQRLIFEHPTFLVNNTTALHVRADNHPAINLYKSLGFVFCDVANWTYEDGEPALLFIRQQYNNEIVTKSKRKAVSEEVDMPTASLSRKLSSPLAIPRLKEKMEEDRMILTHTESSLPPSRGNTTSPQKLASSLESSDGYGNGHEEGDIMVVFPNTTMQYLHIVDKMDSSSSLSSSNDNTEETI